MTAALQGDGPVGRTILLVDDEFDTRFVARLLLENAGHTVVEAINGRDAIERLAGGGIDAVVTDVDMPDMDGPALVRAMRAEPATADLPVLAWGEREPVELAVQVTLPKGAGVRQLVGGVAKLLGEDATWND